MNSPDDPIGFFDSGVGGLTVRRAVTELLPRENTVYLGDSENCPYGEKPAETVRELALGHVGTLVERGCKLVVVACNTATAAAIDELRARFRGVPVVGMEPAVKPAAATTESGVVGVLATEVTRRGRLYRETSEKFASGVKIVFGAAGDLVTLAQRGRTEGAEAEEAVARYVTPLLDAGADRIVLGCTHFPLFMKTMEKVIAGRAQIIDPAPAIARRVRDLLARAGLLRVSDVPPRHEMI